MDRRPRYRVMWLPHDGSRILIHLIQARNMEAARRASTAAMQAELGEAFQAWSLDMVARAITPHEAGGAVSEDPAAPRGSYGVVWYDPGRECLCLNSVNAPTRHQVRKMLAPPHLTAATGAFGAPRRRPGSSAA